MWEEMGKKGLEHDLVAYNTIIDDLVAAVGELVVAMKVGELVVAMQVVVVVGVEAEIAAGGVDMQLLLIL